VDSKIQSHSACPTNDWRLPGRTSEKRVSHDRPSTGPTLIVTLLLSLALWAGIWGIVSSLASLPASPHALGLAFNEHSNQLQKRLMLGMWATPAQKRQISISVTCPPDGTFAVCLTNSVPVSGARARYHLSPFGLLYVNRHRTGTLHDFGYLLDSAIIIIARRGPDRRRSGPRLRSNKQAESAS
jgi:hypothetical protein